MTPQELLELNNDAFKSIVNSDIRGELDQITEGSLKSPSVMDRWYDSLVSTKRSIETQLATFKIERVQRFSTQDYDEWLRDKLKWRAGALRFKSSVEEKIAECKSVIRNTP